MEQSFNCIPWLFSAVVMCFLCVYILETRDLKQQLEKYRSIEITADKRVLKEIVQISAKPVDHFKGVAVTTFLGAPKWFQNRYSLMVNQLIPILEEGWTIQVFYDPSQKMALQGVSYPGIAKQIEKGYVKLTPIPKSMRKIKKNALIQTQWFWENVLAENVLLFGGTSVVCANSVHNISDFTSEFDYVGSPWRKFSGTGGDGGVSLRSRSAMLNVLKLQADVKSPALVKEDVMFVKAMETSGNYKLAKKQDTYKFGMIDGVAEGTPLTGSGILAGLDDQRRQEYLDYCPEMKMMFPSLHNPSCFGAEPNALECFKYLCITSRLRCGEKFKSLSFFDKKNRKVTIKIDMED